MKRLLNLMLILTSLLGYLEWGVDNSAFLFQAEYEIFTKLFSDPISGLHPFVVLPLIGQLLLLITLFQKEPGKRITLIGIGCVGLLLGLMFIIGIIGPDIKILLSTLPFIVTATIVVLNFRKKG
jgi:NAD/NADP transhydrogenase beta subunit